VALKIIKPGMDTREVIARFEAERQALAMMDHPNIAQVLEAGVTGSGRPYFVMELVNGVPLTDYCDQNRLTTDERLKLFVQVCHAVEHAHQKGIIHRDIKPSNVMVTLYDGGPVPKIIDFGVAKSVSGQLTEKTLFTHHGQMLGTPLYMSPEQAEMSGLDVDTRCDIYSLGVLLYELLTGGTPFDRERVREMAYDELRRMIREDDPPRPSDRISTLGAAATVISGHRKTDAAKLSQLLRRELDWIVMKSLQKDRTQRYQTATDFARDVQHYLAHEPVHAGPPGNWYRARKFVRRFRVPLSVAAGFASLLVVITILAVRGYYREAKLRSDTEIARSQAENEAEKARDNFKMARDAVQKYYAQVANDPRLKPHNLETLRRDLLASANEYYEKLSSQELNDLDVQHMRALAFIARGDIEREIGNWSEAETAYNKALAAATLLIPVYSTHAEFQNLLAGIHGQLGVLYSCTGRPKEAEAADKEAIAIWKSLLEKNPEVPQYQLNLGNWRHNMAVLYLDIGRAKEAEAAFKEAIALRKTLLEKHPEDPGYQRDLAASHGGLGQIYFATGRVKEAEAAHEQAFVIRKRLVGKYPEEAWFLDSLANSYISLGRLYQRTGRARAAEVADKEALTIRRMLAEKHPDVSEYQNELSIVYDNLGCLYMDTNRAKEAEAAYEEALTVQKTLVGKHPDSHRYQNELAWLYFGLGLLYVDTSRAKEAEAAYGEALAMQKILVEKHPEVTDYQDNLADIHGDMGILYRATGRTKEAEAAYEEALAVQKILVEKHPEVTEYQRRLASIYNNRGLLYEHTGRAKEAEAACQSALAIIKPLSERTPDISACLALLSSAYYNLACFRAITLAETNAHAGTAADQSATSADSLTGNAFEYLQQACDHGYFDNPKSLERMKGESDLDVLRDRPEYKKLLEKIAARPKPDSERRGVLDPHDVPFDSTRAEALVNRGLIHSDRGEWEQAEADFKEALRVNPFCAQAFFERGEALAKANPERALAAYRKAAWLDPRPQYTEAYLRQVTTPAEKRPLDQMLVDFRQLLRLRAENNPACLQWMSCWLPVTTRGAENLPGVIWVSNMPWVRSTCGYGCPEATRDGYLGGSWLCVAGFPNAKGIGTHAFAGATPADVVLDISGRKFAVLKTQAGLNDSGGVRFQVLIDGKVKHQTQVVHYGVVEPISLDVTGAEEIVLRVLNDGSNGNFYDSVGWGYARFIQAGAEDPLEEPPVEFHSATDANAALFLAEVHWRLDHKEVARHWYNKAGEWIDKHKTDAEKLRKYSTDAGKLLGMPETPPPAKQEPEKANRQDPRRKI
jgi:serine/threonine protein kinase